jgi:Fe-S cluster assembly protein SufD
MNEHWSHPRTLLSAELAPRWQAWRANNFATFLAQGFPNKKQEEWRHTDVSAIADHTFQLVKNSELPTHSALPAGVIFASLAEALQTHSEIIEPYLKLIKKSNPFVDLNFAFLQAGLFLYVPKNVVIPQPVQWTHYLAALNEDAMQHSCQVIVLEPQAQLSLVEVYNGDNQNKYFNNILTAIFVNEGASLTYYKCQNETLSTYHIANTQITQQANSIVKSFNFSLGAQLARDDLQILLNGEGAHCELYGLYMPRRQQHIDNHTAIVHQVANCSSQQLYKGILNDDATAVFNGKILVQPQAQNTQAQQTNRNLLLSKIAQINTKPQLEIYADQVQCQHGATVGQLDKDAIFYLQSRGINAEEATRMLTYAFAEEVLEKIPSSNVSNFIRALYCHPEHREGSPYEPLK